MAALPAEVEPTSGTLLAASDGAVGRFLNAGAMGGLGSLALWRQLGVLLGFAGAIALGVTSIFWLQSPDYRPLTGNWSSYDVAAVTDLLNSQQIPFHIDAESGMLLVANDQLANARMALAKAELLNTDVKGYEALDGEQPFGSSQFAENQRHQRALEGELARSIMTIGSVKTARVHVAMPRGSAFLRDERVASASVALVLRPGKRLSKEDVRAITQLVSSAVPDLAVERVAVVDQHGELLSDQDQDDPAAETDRQYQYARKIEADMVQKLSDILAPTVGEGRFRAQVTADIDFTWHEQTAEQFDPDAAAVRSERTLQEERVGDLLEAGIPGALSNEPPAVAAVPEEVAAATGAAAANAVPPSKNRQEATRNYEVDRTISHQRSQLGRVRRLTVSVVVDDVPSAGEANALTYVPWADAELTRLSDLVKSAIGYDASRGDVVSVVNAPFVATPEEVVEEQSFWQEPWFLELSKQLTIAAVVIIIALGVLRPLFKSLITTNNNSGGSNDEPEGITSLLDEAQIDETFSDVVSVSPGGRSLVGGGTGYGSQLDAVRALIAEDPARVAAVVKSWVAMEE